MIGWGTKNICTLVETVFSRNVYLKDYFIMAKQRGKYPLVGTIGGINFYYLNGEPIARIAGGGFTSEAIKNSPNMQIVRDYNSEFGHASHISKFFRRALIPFYYDWDNRNFHWELLPLFMKLKDLDHVNERGKRRVSEGANTQEGKKILREFEYTPDFRLASVLPFRYEVGENFQLNICDVDPGKIAWRQDADGIELNYAILKTNFEYEYVLHPANSIRLERDSGVGSLHFELSGIPERSKFLLAVAGCRFYRKEKDEIIRLSDGKSLGISVLECW